MLSVATKVRLLVFIVISVLVVALTGIYYIHLPRLLGFQQMKVTADFDDASGIYTNAIVTYRGVDVGRVTSVDLVPGATKVVLSIDDDRHIPADSIASIHSTSAIGEQYVDLVPTSASTTGPTLHDGSVIAQRNTRELPSTAELITRLDDLLQSVPKTTLTRTVNDLYTALNGTGPALRSLIDSSSQLIGTAQQNLGATNGLMRALGPFLGTQQDLAPQTTSTVTDLRSFSNQLVLSNDDIVTLLRTTPSLVQQTVALQRAVTPTLPQLLANLASTGDILRLYDPAVRQLLSIFPTLTSGLLEIGGPAIKTNTIPLAFHTQAEIPPSCITGYLPPTQRRDPSVMTQTETPKGLYCRQPKTSQIDVRGSRNMPCLNANIGTRAATPAQCLGLTEAQGAALYDTVTIPGTKTVVDNSGQTSSVAASEVMLAQVRSPATERGRTLKDLLSGPGRS